MSRRAVFLVDAVIDMRAALAFYGEVSPEVARRFALALKRALGSLLEFPLSGRPVDGGMRSKRIPEFPYAVIYEAGADEIVVAAIAHSKRAPGYWRT